MKVGSNELRHYYIITTRGSHISAVTYSAMIILFSSLACGTTRAQAQKYVNGSGDGLRFSVLLKGTPEGIPTDMDT